MSPLDPLADPGANDNDEESRFRPQFRVLMIGGARKAFRLESAFWNALEVLSRRNGRSLAGEVEARVAASPSDLNASSALRASLAAELMDLWAQAESRIARPQWPALVAAVPAPAFIVSRRSVLMAVNEPLLTYLEGQRPGRGVPLNTLPGALDMSVETPPSAIAELVADPTRRFVTCNVVFKSQGRRVGCRVRLSPIDGATLDTPALLGFIDPSQG
jgi:predicted DNA-binding ribbon-helix-helix protein